MFCPSCCGNLGSEPVHRKSIFFFLKKKFVRIQIYRVRSWMCLQLFVYRERKVNCTVGTFFWHKIQRLKYPVQQYSRHQNYASLFQNKSLINRAKQWNAFRSGENDSRLTTLPFVDYLSVQSQTHQECIHFVGFNLWGQFQGFKQTLT